MPKRSRNSRDDSKDRAALFPAEAEPFRQDWFRLTPGQRLLRSWRMRAAIKDLRASHDAKSLPRL